MLITVFTMQNDGKPPSTRIFQFFASHSDKLMFTLIILISVLPQYEDMDQYPYS